MTCERLVVACETPRRAVRVIEGRTGREATHYRDSRIDVTVSDWQAPESRTWYAGGHRRAGTSMMYGRHIVADLGRLTLVGRLIVAYASRGEYVCVLMTHPTEMDITGVCRPTHLVYLTEAGQ